MNYMYVIDLKHNPLECDDNTHIKQESKKFKSKDLYPKCHDTTYKKDKHSNLKMISKICTWEKCTKLNSLDKRGSAQRIASVAFWEVFEVKRQEKALITKKS